MFGPVSAGVLTATPADLPWLPYGPLRASAATPRSSRRFSFEIYKPFRERLSAAGEQQQGERGQNRARPCSAVCARSGLHTVKVHVTTSSCPPRSNISELFRRGSLEQAACQSRERAGDGSCEALAAGASDV